MAASMSSTTGSTGVAQAAQPEIDPRLLKAAMSGDSRSMMKLAGQDPSILLGTTPHGNNCLHISSIHGHEEFCRDVLHLNQSLLNATNIKGETPLLTSVTSGHPLLASFLRGHYHNLGLSDAILKQDEDGCNVLHHAIRSGHKDLALELIAKEPVLSEGVNKYKESPMFIAVMRDFTEVFRKLLENPKSSDEGNCAYNALHAAVRNGNPVIAKELMDKRPWLVRGEASKNKNTPMQLAAIWGKTDVLRALLEHDSSLGYAVHCKDGAPLLNAAAFRGYVSVARELLKHCPDAPYRNSKGRTCLHVAVSQGHAEFVRFILESPHLGKIINMRDAKGKTALHLAVKKCDTKIVAALLAHRGIDITVEDDFGEPAAWLLPTKFAKTINWNEVSMLLSEADPKNAASFNLQNKAKQRLTESSRKHAKALTQTYTSNTSLVAILLATITFAAAFTLPGGYRNDAGNEGLPVMARKFAFKSFLIADSLAMCSSLAVAFICIVAKWEDLQFLLHYRSVTKKLMWFAYMATTVAFATGLYTVLAPRLLWLAIVICILSVSLPIITYLLGKWPILKLRYRLGKTYKSDLLDMV